MINLNNLRLADIAPDSIKIPDVLAFFNALDPELQKITRDIGEALIMTRIHELPEEIVDLLAWQLHVDFYEPLGLDLKSKRELVKNSLIWHRYKGTKYVLESMIRLLFFDNFKIEEWFEYGGRPYFFRLISHSSLGSFERHLDLFRAIHELKNERSWLDYVIFVKETEPIPAIVASLYQHTPLHLTHPADRAITQEHTSPAIPIISAVFAKHAIKHIVTPQKRDFTKDHNTATAYLINTGFVKHIIEHTVTPQKRDVNNTAEVYLISTGLAKHAIKHTVTPQTRDITSMSAISITNTGKTKHAVKHSSIPF